MPVMAVCVCVCVCVRERVRSPQDQGRKKRKYFFYLSGHDVWDVAVVKLGHQEPLGSRLVLPGCQLGQSVSAVEAGEKVGVIHTLHRALGEAWSGQGLVDVGDHVRPVLENLTLFQKSRAPKRSHEK